MEEETLPVNSLQMELIGYRVTVTVYFYTIYSYIPYSLLPAYSVAAGSRSRIHKHKQMTVDRNEMHRRSTSKLLKHVEQMLILIPIECPPALFTKRVRGEEWVTHDSNTWVVVRLALQVSNGVL